MKKKMKKAFTLVELLVVIAILAVLSTVAIVGYNSFTEKARISNDKTLVTQLNKLLQADEAADGKAKFANDALAVVAENGFDVKKMTPTTDDYDIIWNEESNRFVLLDNKGAEVIETLSSKAHLNWQFSSDTTPVKEGFSIYLNDKFTGTEVTVSSGLDVGSHTGIETINYVTNDTEEVTFRTNGGTLNIDAPNATVNHYGTAVVVNVNDVASSTYNLFGEAQFVKVADGEHVVLKIGSTVNTVYVAGTNNKVEAQNGQTGNVYTSADGSEEDIKTSGTLFAGGLGTEASPYLIKNVEQLANIDKLYEKGFYNFKVADGVETLDLSVWANYRLNGSFDGNDVEFINVSKNIFKKVGSGNSADSKVVKLSNFKVRFAGGTGVVGNNGAANLEFNNVSVSGYLLCEWNAGIFLRYGTNNVTNNGFDYTVSFINCSSNAEVYSSQNAYSAILIGHTYPGTGNIATINVDANTNNNIDDTVLYYTGTAAVAFGNKYYCTGSAKLNVEGIEEPVNKITGTNVVKVDSTKAPAKAEDGSYKIDVEADSAKVVVSLLWQYTLYTENYEEKIPSQSGVGGELGENIIIEISDEELVLLESITNIEIVTGSDTFTYEIKDGKLTIYMTTDNNFVEGNLTLTVEQFTSSSNIAKYKGSLLIASNVKGEWTIK